jgi:hypothetical protein
MHKSYRKSARGRRQSAYSRFRSHSRHLVRSRFLIMLALVLIAGAAAMFIRQGLLNAHSAPRQNQVASVQGTCQQQGAYRYYALKQQAGDFMLARAAIGSSGQPLGAPQPVATFGNGFGQLESDGIYTMQLSPDGCYLAIDGTLDHGEQVWVYDIRRMSLTMVPANVMGNFLSWLPGRGAGSNGHSFLYRPMMPLGPGAPRVDGAWNPGLWIVNAATGQYRNIDIHMSSAFLVDAAASPDGARIVYSTSSGLGLGSQTWMMNADGSRQSLLFSLPGGGQSITAMFAWSPDGSAIAYERLSDSPVPFQPAGLWLMNGNGGASRLVATADGGHGYGLTWSPDGRSIAYIVRTNTGDRTADYNAQSLQCGIAILDVVSGTSRLIAAPTLTGMQINDHPEWITGGTGSMSITFTAYNPFNLVIGGSPRYWSAQVMLRASGLIAEQIRPQVIPNSPALSHIAAIGE